MVDQSTVSTVGSPDSRKIEPYPIPTDTLTLPAPPPKQEGEDSGSDKDHTVRECPKQRVSVDRLQSR